MNKMLARERILETAYRLFQEKGYDHVTINEICEHCQLTKTAFYYHFDSKESLLMHYYDDVTEKINQKSLAFVLADNYWEQLLVIFEEILDSSDKLGVDIHSQLFIMNLKEDRGTFNFNRTLIDICVAVIGKAQKAGQIRNHAAAPELFQTAGFLFTGYEVMWCIKKGGFDRKQWVRQSLEVLFDVAPELSSAQRLDAGQIFRI